MITSIKSKSKNVEDDITKFKLVRRQKGNSYVKKETLERQIQQIEQVHKDYPKVRFYDFHKQAERYYCDGLGGLKEECPKGRFLPDGYFFHYNAIFLIEIVNYSRLSKEKISNVIDWWFVYDCIEAQPVYLMEFDRWGKYVRDVFSEPYGRKKGKTALKECMNSMCESCHKNPQMIKIRHYNPYYAKNKNLSNFLPGKKICYECNETQEKNENNI